MTNALIDKPVVAILGGGPAGLTAAYELALTGQFKPIVFEALDDVGGIARTINHRGNRMDIGGHRFFSKSDWVMNWWRTILPPAAVTDDDPYRIPSEDRVMLTRPRLSRIYFLRKFFDYPISLNLKTMANLGPVRMVKIGVSYIWAYWFPIKPEKNLEDFFINRFGNELYRTFFKDYTEKVWGVDCKAISPEWGAQRIKGLSIWKALAHAARQLVPKRSSDVSQKGTETSLIERFLYPKFGPGQMWNVVKEKVEAMGAEVHLNTKVVEVQHDGNRVVAVCVEGPDQSGQIVRQRVRCDWTISTLAIKDLINITQPPAPPEVSRVANGLAYRDFLTIGLLVRKLKPSSGTIVGSALNLVPDTWIYIQEPDVRIGRLQIFNNWSPALVADPVNTVWMGLEYFVEEGDDLWGMADPELSRFAASELSKINLIDPADVLDTHVVRVPKAYPAYFGTHGEFPVLRAYADSFDNCLWVGRNGMHRYNNQDHSMLAAKYAVERIIDGSRSLEEIWTINTEEEYHEQKSTSQKSG